MASFTPTHYFKTLIFTILFLKALSFNPTPLFSFADFEKDLKFKSNIVGLYGNAKVVKGESKIQFFSGSESSGATGRVVYKKPIKLFQGKPKQLVSFSTYFTFSISKEDGGGGDGLGFVMIPNGSKGDVFNESSLSNRDFEVIGIEFGASRDSRNGIFISFKGKRSNSNKFSTNWGLKIGEKLHAWIDYEASSRQLEVRLSQHGKNSRPSEPLLWHTIDLSNVLKEKEVFVGLSPLKGNVFLYSWSFVLRHIPHSMMHSEPLDPKVFVKNIESPVAKPREKERSDCVLRVLAAMIFGTGCGALIAFIGLYLWTIFGSKRAAVVPEGCVMQPVDRKVNIVVDDSKTIVAS